MTLKEVLIALVEGKKVRKKHWNPNEFIFLKDNCLYDEDNMGMYTLSNYPTDVWEIYQEPKKKVTKYLWASEDGKIGAYFNEKEYTKYGQEKGQNVPYNIRLDWSATEFEVEG